MPSPFQRPSGSVIAGAIPIAALIFGVVVIAQPRDATIAGTQATRVTFTKDIAPILFDHCGTCHRPDGPAPFALLTYEDATRHASQISAVTKRRYMPPWKPEAGDAAFVGERRLTDRQIHVIERWVSDGRVEGSPSDLPPQPRWAPGWQLGEPDLVVTLPEYELQPDGPDIFRNFVVAIPGTETRYVSGIEFRPGNRAVHHSNIRIDTTLASRRLDDADPAPGYDGLILFSADYPDGHFLGWTPGKVPQLAPSGLAWRLSAGSDFVVQLHLQPTGKTERIQPRIGLFFTNRAPTRTLSILRLGRRNLDIAPGVSAYRTRDSYTLPVDVEVQSIQPHAHYRAREVSAWATLPNGTRRSLIAIRDWDFNWQDLYQYAKPFQLPAGTRLEMEYIFDNSASNPRNPDRPPRRILWGPRSSDEMSDVLMQVMTSTGSDRERLDADFRRKSLTEDVVGLETQLTTTPDFWHLHNDAGLIYLELGRPDRAIGHFEAVTRLQPQSAPARFNLGTAFEAAGRIDEATRRYREARDIDVTYAAAESALGRMLLLAGDTAGAIDQLQRALILHPDDAGIQLALARSLAAGGKVTEAVSHYEDALRRTPDCVACLEGLAWLLSVHWDAAVRQPANAVRLARRAVDLTNARSVTALQVLAAAYGASGRFDEAVRNGEAAAALAVTPAMDGVREQIRQQLVLYRRNQPFVVPGP